VVKVSRVSIDLEEYRSEIHLDKPFKASEPAPALEKLRSDLVDELLANLETDGTFQRCGIRLEAFPSSYTEKRRLLKALLTGRSPDPLPKRFHTQMDHLLQYEKGQITINEAAGLPQISQMFTGSTYGSAELCTLWKGDITTLGVDVIVNAANAQMLGCFEPFHNCIDNIIHSAAGPRLREDCDTIMHIQGNLEGTGWAKITRGYNLPSRYVLHTVGPIIPAGRARISNEQEDLLSNSYRSCLELAGRIARVRSLAFCCISTGVFGFPHEPAASIALKTVHRWLRENPRALDLVVFNAFTQVDFEIYTQLLSR
jgi:O-acetyl-ADP-ribose deacetylase (regulator of RNase III)